MAKKIVSCDDIKNGGDKQPAIALFGLFAVAGIGFTVGTLVSLLKDISMNNIITFVVVTCLFGIPFGYFLGIKKVVFRLKRNIMIKKGQVFFFVDEVIDKTRLGNTTDSHDHKEYQLTTKVYSEKTRKNVLLPSLREFNSTKIGETCILCFTAMSRSPFRVYPCSIYELADELKGKCVEDIDHILSLK